MRSVTYVSSATMPFSEAELEALLVKSRSNNAKVGLTGLLLHKGGNFMQVLEGEEEAIHTLLQTLRADSRHKGLIILLDEQIERRDFSDWTMGYRNLQEPGISHMSGYKRFQDVPLTSDLFRERTGETRKLLGLFNRLMND